jgi:hypothetical protein
MAELPRPSADLGNNLSTGQVRALQAYDNEHKTVLLHIVPDQKHTTPSFAERAVSDECDPKNTSLGLGFPHGRPHSPQAGGVR